MDSISHVCKTGLWKMPWYHMTPCQSISVVKRKLLFQRSKLSGSYSRHMSILLMSEKCCKVRVATELYTFDIAVLHSQLSKSEWDCTAWAKLFSECISYISAFLTSNWKSLWRVKTCSASLTLLILLWDRGNCSVLMQSKVRISVQTCTSNQDCDEWSLEMCCPSSAFHLDIG